MKETKIEEEDRDEQIKQVKLESKEEQIEISKKWCIWARRWKNHSQ